MLPINRFPRNNWYVAAFSEDVGTAPVARTVCGDAVALFRTQSGRLAAVEDRCVHRGMPFTHGGECSGEIIRCPYHGLEFDTNGKCVAIPGQDRIPEGAKLITYPVREQDRLIWIWMGDPAIAAGSSPPEHIEHSDAKWARASSIFMEVKADWQLVNDNLLDLTHLPFVHKQTIGASAASHTSDAHVETRRIGRRIEYHIHMPNVVPPPMYLQSFDFKGKIDRWQEMEFLPGRIRLWTGGTDAGTGALEGKRQGGVQFVTFHGITPSTATTCYYHFTRSINFGHDDKALHARLHEASVLTVELEDKPVIEALQQRTLQYPDRVLIDTRWDVGPRHARRIVEEMIEEEKQPVSARPQIMLAQTA
ncbi:MAG: Rieske 2Fe-2S domain-containing protein [Burkholderiales bacterium]